MYLSKLTIKVTQFDKCICLNCKMYLSKLKNAGLQRALSLALKMSAKAPSLTSCSPDSPQRLLEVESVWWNISRLGLRLAVAGWKQPARPMPPSLSSPITLPASPPLRLLWPYWPQLPKLSAALLFPPPPPSPSACSTGKRGLSWYHRLSSEYAVQCHSALLLQFFKPSKQLSTYPRHSMTHVVESRAITNKGKKL